MEDAKLLRKLEKEMRKAQDAKRFEHTLGVEFTAAALAMRYSCSVTDAQIAGVLHDCAKCLSDEKRLKICDKNGIPVSDIERRNPFLLHAKAGAWLAEEKYGVRNRPEIINAIRYHTTGREDMSLLEKIVFVADYIEPGRRHAPNLPEIRRLAFDDLDRAVLRILEDTLEHLKKNGGEIDPMTETAYRYYRENVR
ncbi:MAG: bis(5'-nucleosyl)-tetraphosphatase (symmetrical) YqeK [Firmicutes bacterium]|nr:bis(5'-nucleosyl)-tetraphosphatase (symmetrical) YqeK [Bacillota bacterium]